MRVKAKCGSCGKVIWLWFEDDDEIAGARPGEYFVHPCPACGTERAIFEVVE